MAVVKADGYGHGAVPVARAALDAGATWLGVATLDEGVELRHAGIVAPVLVLGVVDPHDVATAAGHRLDLTLGSLQSLEEALAVGVRSGLHLKVDTGMMRLGIMPDQVLTALDRLATHGAVLTGCYTHFAAADEIDASQLQEQMRRFEGILPAVRTAFPQVIIHAANSAATMAFPQTRYGMVRVGIALYGVPPAPHLLVPRLRPAMRLRSRVVRVVRVAAGTPVSYGARYRPPSTTTIATVACGYADGYPRLAWERAEVLIRGRRCPVAGTVCMDHLMADVRDAEVASGDRVELFGEEINVCEVATWARTISYEILCRIGRRIPRVYVSN